MNTIWVPVFEDLINKKEPILSPFDGVTPLKFAYMRFGEFATLFIWDDVNKKKGIFSRIRIPENIEEIPTQNGFLSGYELVSSV
ncbi:hypothetical protein [Streptococcus cuniculipharyngis]|uniref:Uncharacterized protein n=1 Tax=Streptococcus cuniculipharyngis TaxID=1562651 RepID=A0A5C5SG81_9STRE|nr:hypothetical protein [Streptococcus cuniculipharyngis]TWS99148.1 hypothetical protein FRX57_02820 [Streptococcus cuniculipharyngis]